MARPAPTFQQVQSVGQVLQTRGKNGLAVHGAHCLARLPSQQFQSRALQQRNTLASMPQVPLVVLPTDCLRQQAIPWGLQPTQPSGSISIVQAMLGLALHPLATALTCKEEMHEFMPGVAAPP